MPKFLLLCLTFLLLSCQSERPFVVTNPSQLADLYWEAQLTDGKGNRWEVFILPGIKPMIELGEEGWETSGEFIEKYGDSSYWSEHKDLVTMCTDFITDDCWEFSKDAMVEYGAKGIKEDVTEASKNISNNFREAPFGWIPRIAGNALWGYIAKPVFRTATAPVGAALGGVGATLGGAGIVVLPTGWLIAPTFLSIGSASCIGLLVPVSGMTGHQIAFLLVFPNREPAEKHDGEFGLHIVNRSGKNIDEVPPAAELIPQKVPHIKAEPIPQIAPEKQLSQNDVLQVLEEYLRIKELEIKHMAKIKKMKHLGTSPGGIYVISEDFFCLDEKAKQYVEKKLKQDFSQRWKKLHAKLSKEERKFLQSEREAYEEFGYLFAED